MPDITPQTPTFSRDEQRVITEANRLLPYIIAKMEYLGIRKVIREGATQLRLDAVLAPIPPEKKIIQAFGQGVQFKIDHLMPTYIGGIDPNAHSPMVNAVLLSIIYAVQNISYHKKGDPVGPEEARKYTDRLRPLALQILLLQKMSTLLSRENGREEFLPFAINGFEVLEARIGREEGGKKVDIITEIFEKITARLTEIVIQLIHERRQSLEQILPVTGKTMDPGNVHQVFTKIDAFRKYYWLLRFHCQNHDLPCVFTPQPKNAPKTLLSDTPAQIRFGLRPTEQAILLTIQSDRELTHTKLIIDEARFFTFAEPSKELLRLHGFEEYTKQTAYQYILELVLERLMLLAFYGEYIFTRERASLAQKTELPGHIAQIGEHVATLKQDMQALRSEITTLRKTPSKD